jgi:hypothetical protein
MKHPDITPRNTGGELYYEVESIEVAEWHSLPDGQGKPEQVHLILTLADNPIPLVVRFKSRRPVDSLIMALMTHANGVWPKC